MVPKIVSCPAYNLRKMLRSVSEGGVFEAQDWDLLVRQARRSGLLSRLCAQLEEKGLIDNVPHQPRQHFIAERILADKQARDVLVEVRRLQSALAGTGAPIVVLKGAAYVLANLPPARGRLFSDIDIMVPLERLYTVEAALKERGWSQSELKPYDEQYYRRWMHQIPPMTSVHGITADIHHTIVARTRRLDLEAAKLFAAAIPIPGYPGISMLAPADMILHSAAHLLNEGDFDRGLRDIDDINLLLRHFQAEPEFWPGLLKRATELDLKRPLFYALRYTAQFLGTPIPDEIRDAVSLKPPGPALQALMDPLFERALRPAHPSCQDRYSALALWLLYLRGHYLLMPPYMLVPHLIRKWLMQIAPEEKSRPGLRDPQKV